jgi:hypothetical protein
MKTNIVIKIDILIVLISFLVACSSILNNPKEKSFAEIVPIPLNEMNSVLTLSIPVMEKGVYVPKQGDILTLALNNHSKDIIVFPSDYGINLYQYNNDVKNWIEIKNLGNYVPEGNRQISPRGGENLGQILIGALPDLPWESNPVEIRVVVIGTVSKDNKPTSEQVGAYTDVTLQP